MRIQLSSFDIYVFFAYNVEKVLNWFLKLIAK